MLLKCGHIALPWGAVRALVQGNLVRNAWCDDCNNWSQILRKPQLMELIGLEPTPELPIDPPF